MIAIPNYKVNPCILINSRKRPRDAQPQKGRPGETGHTGRAKAGGVSPLPCGGAPRPPAAFREEHRTVWGSCVAVKSLFFINIFRVPGFAEARAKKAAYCASACSHNRHAAVRPWAVSWAHFMKQQVKESSAESSPHRTIDFAKRWRHRAMMICSARGVFSACPSNPWQKR